MSGSERPPVDLTLGRQLSFEREFAELAFETLDNYGEQVDYLFDSINFKLQDTDVVDLTAEDQSDLSFRLRNVPVILVEDGARPESDGDAARYCVLDLQYGHFDDEYESPTDEAYNWQSYVKVIIDTDDLDEVMIVDGQTYEKVAGNDLNHAHFILGQLRHTLRGMLFEEEVRESNLERTAATLEATPAYKKGKLLGHYVELDISDDINTITCERCQGNNHACVHAKDRVN